MFLFLGNGVLYVLHSFFFGVCVLDLRLFAFVILCVVLFWFVVWSGFLNYRSCFVVFVYVCSFCVGDALVVVVMS